MTSKTSSSSNMREFRKIYFWTLKSNKGLAILYTVLCFIALPGILFLAYQSVDRHFDDRLLDLTYSLKTLLIVVAPIMVFFALIFSLLAFTYMHKKRSTDLFHSLPVNRTPLFLGKYVAVVTMLMVPLILNFCLVFLEGWLMGCIVSDFGLILVRFLWILFFSVIITTFCAFFSICCGTTTDAIVSIGVISVFYPLTMIMGASMVSQILPGVLYAGSSTATYMSAFSPFLAIVNTLSDTLDSSFLPWWLCFTAILLIGSILLYRHRKSESAESSFTFPVPVLIRFIGSFAAALVAGSVFLSVFGNYSPNNTSYFWIGAIIGSLLAHIIIEAIYSRGFKKLKRSLLYYAAFAVIFVGASVSVSTGCFGYDTYVPSADAVESVTLSPTESFTENINKDPSTSNNSYYMDHNQAISLNAKLTEKQSIQQVTELHKLFINDFRQQNPYPYAIQRNRQTGPSIVHIDYKLKNGSTVSRQYFLSYNVEGQNEQLKLMNAIADSEEFKRTSQILFCIKPEDVTGVQVATSNTININASTSNTITLDHLSNDVKKELLDAMQKDVLADTCAQREKYQTQSNLYIVLNPLTSTQVYTDNKEHRISFYSNSYNIPIYYNNTRAVISKYKWNDPKSNS